MLLRSPPPPPLPSSPPTPACVPSRLSAPLALFGRAVASSASAGSDVRVRDVVDRQDVQVDADGAITAMVPRHGVALFVVTFGSKIPRRSLAESLRSAPGPKGRQVIEAEES